MALQDMPFVAIVGGFYQFKDPASLAAAKSGAQLLGAELANAGFGLVVYFSNDESLEPHVVTGYVNAIGKGPGAIRVRYAQSQHGKVVFREQGTRPDIFDPNLFPGDDWEAPFFRSLAEEEGVDGVVLLAGGASTLIAGQIALARRLPILAVEAFGGSAAKLWSQLAQIFPEKRKHPWDPNSAARLVSLLKAECIEASKQRDQARQRERMLQTLTDKRAQSVWAAGAFVLLLCALFLGMVYTPMPTAYPVIIFSGLIFAGATGSLVRSVIWGAGESDPRTSLFLGSVAGLVVGLAYLIPQWVGAPGILDTPEVVSATDKIQFVSAVLVALSAGVGFDTVFNRLREQAERVPTGPSGKS